MSLRSYVSAWFKRRRLSHKRLEFRAREGNLDAITGVSTYDPRRTRVLRADIERPEAMGRRVDWPRQVPRSLRYNESTDYEEY